MKKNERTLPLEEDKKSKYRKSKLFFFFKFCTEKISSAISCAHAIIHAVSHTAPKNTVTPRYTERHKHNYLGNKNTMCLNYLILLQVIICNVFGNWNCLLKSKSLSHMYTHIYTYTNKHDLVFKYLMCNMVEIK